VRALLPPFTDGDPLELYTAAERRSPPGRPWVVVNMVCTADGATADPNGRSAGLGGPADREAFHTLRSLADVIVAGSSTVRAEKYGPAVIAEARQEERRARGQAPVPRIAVVSRSLRLDPGMRLFTSGGPRPLVLTSATSDPEARERLAEVADVVVAGDDQVDWHRALAELGRRANAGVVLVEGGPVVNGQLVGGLIDELCLTIAPLLAGGDASRVAHGAPPAEMAQMSLAHVIEDDGHLLLRYVAATGG
jgi:riboflavin-specific deaminase-like protein